MFAKMLKRKVSRVTAEAPDLSALNVNNGGADLFNSPPAVTTNTNGGSSGNSLKPNGKSDSRRNSNASEITRTSLPLQYRFVQHAWKLEHYKNYFLRFLRVLYI